MNRSARTILITLTAALVGSTATPGFANETKDTAWQKAHPRREQVNHRLAKQRKRIHEEVKEGDLTKAQGATLRKDDRQIRQEERDMAAQNGGHITKLEQKALNQQENAVSRQIGK